MFLKSLTLKGFKSFADATTLEFEPGVTVVVGPNGSGKSNVVDAVAWVLGAQGPRTVRSAKMEDVIFAGTPKRAALGRAEVSLTIDNSAGLLPIDFSEVTITRTLFRNGDSEYAINGVSCRLLDVQELLSDTGVGRQQHVIVSQGQLDAVLNARPEDRRTIIEEAAGVLKYRRRREKAQRRLEAIEGDVQRLVDLLREVRRQLKPLERQAEAARRHDGLVEELSGLRRYLAGTELAAISQRLELGGQKRDDLLRADAELVETAARLDVELGRAEAEAVELRQRSEEADLAEALSRAEGLRQRAKGLLALLAERHRSLERDLSAAADRGVIANLEAEAARVTDQLAEVEGEVTALGPQAEELAEAEDVLARETESFDRDWGTAQAAREQSPRPSGTAAEVRGELKSLRSAVERAEAELRRVDGRLATLTERTGRLSSETAKLEDEIGTAEAARQPLADALRQAADALNVAEATLAAAEVDWAQAEGERHRWTARAEALSLALDEARARAGAERLSEIDGFVGTLLELVEVDPGWETAFEAAAGEAVAAVIVDGVDAARRCLEHLRAQDLSGAVLALAPPGSPTPAQGRRPERYTPPGGPAALAVIAVRDHVRSRLPGASALLDRLLDNAVAVEGDWPAAAALAAEQPDLVVVTTEGDRFAPTAWRTGAKGSGATGVALAEAREQAEAATAAAAQAGRHLEASKARVTEARRVRADCAKGVDANVAALKAATEARGRAQLGLQEAASEHQGLAAQRSELAERLAREHARVEELSGVLPSLEQAAAAEAELAAAERSARARLSERAAAVAALRRDLEVRAAGIEERRTLLTRRLAELEERLRRDVAQREDAGRRREGLARAIAATGHLGELVSGRAEEIDRVLAALREARRLETIRLGEMTARLEQLRRERSVCERQLSELRERANKAEVDEAEARIRLENLEEMVRRDLGCEPEELLEVVCPPLPDGVGAAQRANQLERELRQMGPINPLALEEYTALNERHSFVADQLEDVKSAKRELLKVIRAIDDEIVDVFRAAYADVADNFERLFATLFPGGQGRLRLTDPDQLLETGIEVDARPSGKNVRRLSLLSGGERSLTALAFLFAVFRSRPSPFYLMDEVEAALDDVNLHRFLDLLHEFRNEAQLLVVSHQRRTMEAADCLYGVTMQPGGSSKVVSEKIKGAPAPASASA